MKKSLFVAIAIASPFLAHAQFMGIDALPISKQESPKLLINAIEQGNSEFIVQWDKEIGLNKGYDNKNKDYCRVVFNSEKNASLNPSSYKGKEKEIANFAAQSFSTNRDYPYFSHCDNLTLFHLVNQFGGSFPYEESQVIERQKIDSNSKIVKLNPFLHKMVENIAPNQWEMLFPIITNKAISPKTRILATKKIVELYEQREKTALPEQKEFWKAASNFEKEQPQFARTYRTYELATNPLQYLYNSTFFSLVDLTNLVNSQELLEQKLTKDYFLGKKQLQHADFLNLPSHVVEIHTTNAYLITVEKEILDILSSSKSVKIDAQDYNGNTVLHRLWYGSNSASVNRILANFIRAQFEKGFNPMILNAQNATIYGLYQNKANYMSPKGAKAIDEAFKNKEYNY